MGRGCDFSPDEIAQIKAWMQLGMSGRQMAKLLDRSANGVNQCIKRINAGVKTVRAGPKSSITERCRRRILQAASNKVTTAKKIKTTLGLRQSTRTIQKIIKASGMIVYRKKSRKPILKAHEMANREAWCSQRLHWARQWDKIVFSDEKKFNLDGPDGNSFYYHDKRKPELLHNKRHTGGGSVMIWAAIGTRGKSSIAFIDGNINSEQYQGILTNTLLPCGARIGGNRWVFMQDNAPIHTSHSTTEFLANHNIRVLPWPPRSPDLNPIENVWAILSRMVYAGGKQYNSKEELKTAILRCWPQVSGETIRNLYNSMPTRVDKVISKRGMIISY